MDELVLLRQRVQQLEQELADARLILSSELYPLRARTSTLKGFISTLLDDEKEEAHTRDDRREFYTILDENIDHLMRHLNTLREMADIHAGRFAMYWQEAVDIHELTESVVTSYQKHTNKHVVELDFRPEQILVETDPQRFEIILHYLIHNAIKYSPDGGEVQVRARLNPPNEEYPCEMLLLQVKDQGLGLSRQDLAKVGRLFGGRGGNKMPRSTMPNMVLRLIKFLVEAHQGTIWSENEEQDGETIFNVCIPVKQPKREE